jgi:hypothetical protein
MGSGLALARPVTGLFTAASFDRPFRLRPWIISTTTIRAGRAGGESIGLTFRSLPLLSASRRSPHNGLPSPQQQHLISRTSRRVIQGHPIRGGVVRSPGGERRRIRLEAISVVSAPPRSPASEARLFRGESCAMPRHRVFSVSFSPGRPKPFRRAVPQVVHTTWVVRALDRSGPPFRSRSPGGRALLLALPSLDGSSGAAWLSPRMPRVSRIA